MEAKPNDQYVIKIAGTGRLTLRNRRFLRKVREPSVPTVVQQPHQTILCTQPPPIPLPIETRNPPTEGNQNVKEDVKEEVRGYKSLVQRPASPIVEDISSSPGLPTQPLQFDSQDSPKVSSPTRQSTRVRKLRVFYDPSTGGSTEQNP